MAPSRGTNVQPISDLRIRTHLCALVTRLEKYIGPVPAFYAAVRLVLGNPNTNTDI